MVHGEIQGVELGEVRLLLRKRRLSLIYSGLEVGCVDLRQDLSRGDGLTDAHVDLG